ncbi:MAG: AbrB/MazE/SpoVT family DNA-binding domain-containing protein [Thaumarchaeota archaeon]|nr:MAG: AbrB/MazE/SpoVT family DNA-binding domain-containing protein [Nitrososphaerota archaeon]TLZ82865.1 MAG: AbrB/MazE/SpoVT family DNA-binding domain-containing protein [Euryarchaeota archaeon]
MARIIRPVRVSTKGQMIIPVEVRRKLSIKPGDQLVIVSGDSEAIIMKPKRYAESLRGVGKGLYGKTREEIDAYVQGERRAWK